MLALPVPGPCQDSKKVAGLRMANLCGQTTREQAPARMPERAYTTGIPELDTAISALVAQHHEGPYGQMLDEIITSAFKLAMDGADRGEMKLVNTTLKEMRHTFRIFRPYRNHRKVSIFGSARTPAGTPEYDQAVALGRLLAEHGFMIITGAGGGIMRAGHEGAGPEASFGVNIRLPFEQGANDIISGSPRLINYKYFFTRKLAFLKETDAVACLPGGFGTHDEGCESITLVQTGKSRPMPLVFLDAPGGDFWHGFDEYVRRHLLGSKLISPEDLSLYLVTDSAEEATREIVRFYHRYHSSRYVGDMLVIRLQPPPMDGLVEYLNGHYQSILKGPIHASAPLPAEQDEPALANLPRLIVPFDRRHFGRLRQMLDDINAFPDVPMARRLAG